MPAPCLVNRFGVGKTRSSQGHKIELAIRHGLRHLIEQPGETTDADHRDRNTLFHKLGVIHQGARRNHGQQRHCGVVVPGTDIQGVNVRFEHFTKGQTIFQ
ncbi:hypothetical protein D3C86_1378380 [compost metagenome]